MLQVKDTSFVSTKAEWKCCKDDSKYPFEHLIQFVSSAGSITCRWSFEAVPSTKLGDFIDWVENGKQQWWRVANIETYQPVDEDSIYTSVVIAFCVPVSLSEVPRELLNTPQPEFMPDGILLD